MSSIVESEAAFHAFEAEEIDRQLARLLESHHFSRSTRYPALLQFLVHQVQMGNAARLKERLVGIEVFHRTPDYDTNADPVVRVTAAEVRKRIAQYYQEPEHTGELRIDLPTGSYVPRFLPARPAFQPAADDRHAEDGHTFHASALSLEPGVSEIAHAPLVDHADPVPVAEGIASVRGDRSLRTFSFWGPFHLTQRQRLLTVALLIGTAVAGFTLAVNSWINASRTRALRQLWAPMNAGQSPMLFVIGDHSLDDNGHSMGIAPVTQNMVDTVLTQMNQRSQVPLDDLISLDKIHAFLTRDSRSYRDKGAAEATLEDLRSGPVVLFAGFDNRWSVHLSQQLRFRMVPDLDHNTASIIDSKDPSRHWSLDYAEPVNRIASDYGIVARYFDPMLEQNVLLVAGIGSMGTAAASEFVTQERFSSEIVRAAPDGWKNGNFEIVFDAAVMEGHAGPPRIIASTYW